MGSIFLYGMGKVGLQVYPSKELPGESTVIELQARVASQYALFQSIVAPAFLASAVASDTLASPNESTPVGWAIGGVCCVISVLVLVCVRASSVILRRSAIKEGHDS